MSHAASGRQLCLAEFDDRLADGRRQREVRVRIAGVEAWSFQLEEWRDAADFVLARLPDGLRAEGLIR